MRLEQTIMRKNYKILIRRARETDAHDLWCWRNDQSTRRNSLTTKKISFSEHKAWFVKSLKSRFRKIYMATLNRIKIGTVRLDFPEKKIIEVSISIHPQYRNKGLGKQILHQIDSLIKKKYTDRIQKSIIKLSNIASEKLFSTVGYTQIHVVPKLRYSIWIKQ